MARWNICNFKNMELQKRSQKKITGVQIALQIDRLFTGSRFSRSIGSDRQPNMSRYCILMSCARSALRIQSKKKRSNKRSGHSRIYDWSCSRLSMESTLTLSCQRTSKRKQHQYVTDSFPFTE